MKRLTIFASCYELLILVKSSGGGLRGVPWWLFVWGIDSKLRIEATGTSLRP